MTTTERAALVLVLLAALAHAPGLAGGFVYDDHRFVETNDALVSATPTEILLDPATHTAGDDRDVYRPIRTMSHAFDRRRWDLEPFGFRLHNLLAHLVNVALAVLVVRRLLPEAGSLPVWAGVTTLAVHPVGVEVVGMVSSRGDLYALGAAFAALLAVLPAAGRAGAGRLALGALLAALAALSKESALVLPGVAAWHALVIRRERPGRATAALAVGAAAAFALRQVALAGLSPVQTAPHGGDLFSQVGWAFFGLGKTLAHLAAPTSLSIDYPQFRWAADTTSWAEPLTWLVIGLCALPFVLARRAPRWSFAAGWLLIVYLPSSSLLVTLRSLVNDRYAYPALVPFGVAVGLAVSAALRRPGVARRLASTSVPQGVALVLGAALALGWAGASRARSQVFANDLALWTDARRANPDSIPALVGLAAAEFEALAAGDVEAVGRRRALLEEAVAKAPPGTMLEGWALSELGQHLLRVERNPAAALEPLFQGLQLTRHTRDRGVPESDEVVTAVLLAEAHALLGNHDQADAVLRTSLADHARGAASASAVLSIKRAQLAMHRLQDEPSPAAVRRAGQALLDAERNAPGDPLVAAMRAAWDRIEAAPSGATPTDEP